MTAVCAGGDSRFGTWIFTIHSYKVNQRCAAILRNYFTQSLTYQLRNCSDQLAVLCKDENNIREIVIVNVVLFCLIILFVVMIILRKRINIQVCQSTNQKFRRNNIKTTSMVETNENSERNNGVPQNENKTVRGSYTEPWELHHDIVSMGEVYKQDIINVQTEETEA
ncbi:unnamed protein product [Mytilus coruscus]|uniref:Uncharacterized protein n=1 Tax=Mytilus coruscus TaxID=42192 RepID=A0A6J8C920_MYTCO|nr:unnamed protein product [Mytilus coruscus]